MTDTAAAQEFWDDYYGETSRLGTGKANPVLVDEVIGLTPGTALDIGCGEGSDALWLADRGWRVTGVDISPVVLARARVRADQAGVAEQITWLRGDLTGDLDLPAADLVTAHYLHSPVELPRSLVLHRAAAAVAPGGTLLLVHHSQAPAGSGHDHEEHQFPTPDQVLADAALDLEHWTIQASDVRTREHHVPGVEVQQRVDTVLVARRR